MQTTIKTIFLLAFLFISNVLFGQPKHDFLRRIADTTKNEYGYINSKGDTVIPINKYLACYTNKFYKFAIVFSRDKGIVGIDRKENVLFHVYVFDNGPDYPSGGLFRIIKNGKIGYADMNGNIIIEPQFDCAYPFINGKAKVGNGCINKSDGEHSWWAKGEWHTINKKGGIIKNEN